MSLAGVAATSATQNVSPIANGATLGGGAGVPYGVGGGAAGAYIAQGASPSSAGSLIKKVLIGGVVGAGLGFGASFITPATWPAAPVMAAIGAGVGVVGALALHFIGKRKQNLAMQAQAEAAQQQAMAPTAMPGAGGATLQVGSRGPGTRTLQTNLKRLGLFPSKVTGVFDKPTTNAIRRYEVMKGVVPTGVGSPDVRAAIAQDVALIKQYA